MSYTFSRRDFMKYTALTAVAIAGSGMLTGCSNPNRPVGKTGDTLIISMQLIVSIGNIYLEMLLVDLQAHLGIDLKLASERSTIIGGALQRGFTDAVARLQGVSGVTIDLVGGSNASVDAKTTVTPTLKVSGIENLTSASKVQVLYIPKMYANGSITDSYSDIYATWDITDAIKVTIVD